MTSGIGIAVVAAVRLNSAGPDDVDDAIVIVAGTADLTIEAIEAIDVSAGGIVERVRVVPKADVDALPRVTFSSLAHSNRDDEGAARSTMKAPLTPRNRGDVAVDGAESSVERSTMSRGSISLRFRGARAAFKSVPS